jgi:carbonic anhydrase/acetyltransferase-like protein (isoleucine patch superfamily)
MKFPDTVFVHPTAVCHGAVTLGAYSSLWASAVIRAEFEGVIVGRFSNIQDNVTVHSEHALPVTIGDNVTVGHNAVIHAATIEDNCLIGMGAIVLDGAVIGTGTILAAGAVVRERQVIPPHSMVTGIPARVREAKPAQMKRITENAFLYAALARLYKRGLDVTSSDLLHQMRREVAPFFDPKE